ncbi:hypothetical protein C1645_835218 [Glomus cerebriforme]|uniref:Protein kinase domain-containing protein n=1 Tax=Glomus cerebriforme TaxID=658196 RepID=A0A397SE59_9GLOM|nr:hypothetical protein C1645_835218 [Glomus cerebriforme]
MEYASKGDLHNYLQKNFINIIWDRQKLLTQETIHSADFIHQDFYSGNILNGFDYGLYNDKWKIGDLGLSQPANNTSSNN